MKKSFISALALATLIMTGCENPLSQETETSSLTPKGGETVTAATARNLPRVIVARIATSDDVYFNWEAGWDVTTAGKARAVEGGYYPAQTGYDFVPAYGICLAGNAYETSDWGSSWKAVGGSNDFIDVATGGENTFAIGSDGQAYKLDRESNTFSLFGGIPNESVTRIDVDPGGNPWVVTATGDVYSFHMASASLNLEFNHVTQKAKATDIGCGDGRIILAAAAEKTGSRSLYIYGPVSGFEIMEGTTGAIRVDVDKKKNIWMVDERDELFVDWNDDDKTEFLFNHADTKDIGACS